MTVHCHRHDGERGSAKLAALGAATVAALIAAAGFAWSTGMLRKESASEAKPSLVTLSSDRLDFGRVALNDHATRKLILLNEGTQPIEARIAVGADRFAVDPQKLLLHPGVSAQVTVALEGRSLGEFEDELEVSFEEKDLAALVVKLEGEIGEPGSVEPQVPTSLPERLAFEASRAERVQRERATSSHELGNRASSTFNDGRARTVEGYVATGAVAGGPTVTSESTAASAPEEASTVAANTANRNRSASRGGEGDREGTPHAFPPGMGVTVRPYDPNDAAPFRSVSDTEKLSSEAGLGEEEDGVKKLPSRVPGEELPEALPEDPEEDEPALGPTLTISGMSTVRLMGSQATFYPQRLDVAGAQWGGGFNLGQPVQFPTVPLAFGESMLFSQIGAPGGSWDPQTGQVQLELQIQAVDTDGDAAPMILRLTTGTAMARNESGAVVAIDGTPRVPQTGVLRLVAIEKIPVGFKNGGEDRLAVFEILANLSFGNESAANNGFPRIGG